MATDHHSADRERRARCLDCGRVTRHVVSIEVRTESGAGLNARFSREPYRITECRACGRERSVRMDDSPL